MNQGFLKEAILNMAGAKKIHILFVCMGNICRSPTAEGVFKHLVSDHGLEDLMAVDSAGTHAHCAGRPPDARACLSAYKKGYNISQARARKFCQHDFEHFDHILAMDSANRSFLQVKSPLAARCKIELFLDYHAGKQGEDVPDPYFPDSDLFDDVFEMIEKGCWSLLKAMRRQHRL